MYETATDLGNEQEVAALLCDRWKCDAMKLPISYRVDYVLSREGPVALAEIKCRGVAKSQYPTYFISAQKVVAGLTLAEKLGIPFFIVVRWTDCVGFLNPAQHVQSLTIGGRADRGDDQDTEIMVHFDHGSFSELL